MTSCQSYDGVAGSKPSQHKEKAFLQPSSNSLPDPGDTTGWCASCLADHQSPTQIRLTACDCQGLDSPDKIMSLLT